MAIHRKLDDWYHLSSAVAKESIALGDGAIACWTLTGERFSRGKLLHLLRSGHQQWNKWRWSLPDIEWYFVSGRHVWIPGFIIRLPRCDLRQLNFVNCEFAVVDFTNSVFAKSNFDFVDFHRLTIRPVYQPKTVLNGCNFRSSKLVGTILDQTEAIGCDFSHAELNGTRIRGADLQLQILSDNGCGHFRRHQNNGLKFRRGSPAFIYVHQRKYGSGPRPQSRACLPAHYS
jgi:uncharacterized protein YjbI with pentapeptide repeats